MVHLSSLFSFWKNETLTMKAQLELENKKSNNIIIGFIID